MKKNVIIATAAVAVALTSVSCSNKKLIAEKDQQIESMQNEMETLQAQLAAERERSAQLKSDLDQAMSDLSNKEKVWMREREGMMQITIDGSITFNQSSTSLKPEGRDVLNRIMNVVQNYPDRTVLVEGHTDNVPISPQFRNIYPSNWELSTTRAHVVRRYILDTYDVSPDRVGAVGYGEYRPVASNDTAEGRAQNRRVVLTIAPTRMDSKPMP